MSSSEESTECVVCYQVAINTHACTNKDCCRLFCGECVAHMKGNECPICREENTIEPNIIIAKMIDRQKI